MSRVGLYAGHHRVTHRGWCSAQTKGWPQTTRLVDCSLPTHNEEKIGSKREKADGTPNPARPHPRPQMVEQITPWMEGQTNSDPAHQAELYAALALSCPSWRSQRDRDGGRRRGPVIAYTGRFHFPRWRKSSPY